jgi:hypothetical protein
VWQIQRSEVRGQRLEEEMVSPPPYVFHKC